MDATLVLEGIAQPAGAEDFAGFFAAHQRSVYQLAYVLCGDAVLAEDATAEAFTNVYRRWKDGPPEDPAAYLRQAVVNQIRGRFRRLRVERSHADRQSGDDRGVRGFDDLSADHDQLCRALLVLPPKQRAAVVLRYFEDLPEAEVAAVLGTSVGTVKAYVSRGLDRLRHELEPEDTP